MNTAIAPIYHDFQGLSALRSQASSAPSEALGEVAAQFESLFVQIMLKAMREATIEGGLFDSEQMEMYQSMFDQQLSVGLAGEGVLGLSDLLVEELAAPGASDVEQGESQPDAVKPGTEPEALQSLNIGSAITGAVIPVDSASVRMPTNVAEMVPRVGPAVAEGARASTRPVVDESTSWQPGSPEEYVRGVWDHAVEAGNELGLDPRVLVAQSALETGWGKRVIPAVDGGSSFNFFGVKADAAWRGASAAVNSIEFRDGVAALEKASFRVYESISTSFKDYVNFLQDNPRYQQALERVADSEQFLQELQNAGYATDPAYADKIMGIIGRISYGAAMGALKNS